MRIVHVINNLDPANGGPQVVCTSLASAQVSLGHQVEIAAMPHPAAAAWVSELCGRLPGMPRVHIRNISVSGGSFSVLFGKATSPDLEAIINQTDILHLHGLWDPIIKVASDIARRRRKPYAVLVHGMLDPWSLSQRRMKKKLALALGFRNMLDKAAFLHLLNDDEHRLTAPLGIHAPRETIPNGIFLEDLLPRPEPGLFRSKHPTLGDKPVVLFLSRLHYKKGLDYLAEAFGRVAKEVPEAMLVVAGPDGGAEREFRESVARLGIAHRVLMTGPIYGRAKLEALVDATVFCLPSRQEGFSMAITEALGIGTPVVISENCHFPEVSQAGAGSVVQLHADKVADALVKILTNPQLRASQSSAAAQLITSRYTWPRIAEMTLHAYQRHL